MPENSSSFISTTDKSDHLYESVKYNSQLKDGIQNMTPNNPTSPDQRSFADHLIRCRKLNAQSTLKDHGRQNALDESDCEISFVPPPNHLYLQFYKNVSVITTTTSNSTCYADLSQEQRPSLRRQMYGRNPYGVFRRHRRSAPEKSSTNFNFCNLFALSFLISKTFQLVWLFLIRLFRFGLRLLKKVITTFFKVFFLSVLLAFFVFVIVLSLSALIIVFQRTGDRTRLMLIDSTNELKPNIDLGGRLDAYNPALIWLRQKKAQFNLSQLFKRSLAVEIKPKKSKVWEMNREVDYLSESNGGRVVQYSPNFGQLVELRAKDLIMMQLRAPPQFNDPHVSRKCFELKRNEENFFIFQLRYPIVIKQIGYLHLHLESDPYGPASRPWQMKFFGANPIKVNLKSWFEFQMSDTDFASWKLLGQMKFPMDNEKMRKIDAVKHFGSDGKLVKFDYVKVIVLDNHGSNFTCINHFKIY